MTAGVYAIFGMGDRVYVGQSADILRRPTVGLARRLGLDWTIVAYLPGTTRPERQRVETAVHEGYERAGFRLSSIPHPEVIRRAHAAVRTEQRSAAIRTSWMDPARRLAQAERMAGINARRSVASRSDASRRGWQTRRTNTRTGPSTRTQQRRRAELARRVSP